MDYPAEIEAWRRRRIARLTADDGWLSLIGLYWLDDGDNTVGGDPRSRVRFAEGRAPAAAGVIRVEGSVATFLPAPGVGYLADGRSEHESVSLASDASAGPTRLAFGPTRLHLVWRSGRLAARVSDPGSPARAAFGGRVAHFPVDARWRLDARFEPYAPPRKIQVTGILGNVEDEIAPGVVAFEVAGATHRLTPILERGETDYWIIFGDQTNGTDTYGAGRFVYVPPPAGGRTILDFNKAYNPPCVFTPYSTCPLPPPGNRLPIRVEAGEKVYPSRHSKRSEESL